jgi:hypothetical protein
VNRREIVLTSVSTVVGAAAGSAVTYAVVKKKIETRAFAEAEKEIEQVKDRYRLLRKEPPYDDPATAARAYMKHMDEMQEYAARLVEGAEEAAEERVEDLREQLAESLETQAEVEHDAQIAADILQQQEYASAQTPEDKLAINNIFDAAKQARLRRLAEAEQVEEELQTGALDRTTGEQRDPDAFDELSARDPRPPFIISYDEYGDDSNEFSKIVLTYFEGDNTLADDAEHEIPDVEGTVGAANLEQFGVESDSVDSVYIRNERLRVDYQVVLDEGSYNHIVLGLQEMEAHQSKNKPRVKRMRDE